MGRLLVTHAGMSIHVLASLLGSRRRQKPSDFGLYSWDDFRNVTDKVLTLRLAKEFWRSRAFRSLQQVGEHLDQGLLPNLRLVHLYWGQSAPDQSVALFRSRSVREVSLFFQPPRHATDSEIRMQLHDVTLDVATAFPETTKLLIQLNTPNNEALSLGQALPLAGFTRVRWLWVEIPVGRGRRLHELVDAIAFGIPRLEELYIRDLAPPELARAEFPSMANLARCHSLRVFSLFASFGLCLSPEAWHCIASTWTQLTEFTVRAPHGAQLSPEHVGGWPSLQAIAAANWISLRRLCLPLALGAEDPPPLPIVLRRLVSLELECVQRVQDQHVEAAAQFFAHLIESPPMVQDPFDEAPRPPFVLHPASSQSTSIQDRVGAIVASRVARPTPLLRDTRWTPVPRV